MEIDLVIPYVNASDPVGQREYEPYSKETHKHEESFEARYRDGGTLKYVFRSIEKYIPWVNKIFLVVSGPSQIPDGLDTNNPKLRIVYHKDYIPERFLPTFNANTIECFLGRIPDLSENFIYGNDDFFFLTKLNPTDFFENGKLRINLKFKQNPNKKYLQFCEITHNSLVFGSMSKNIKEEDYVLTDHTFSPKRKSKMKKLFEYYGEKLYSTFTTKRDSCNVNQYVFDVYELYSKNVIPSSITSTCVYVDNNLFEHSKDKNTICVQDKDVSDFNTTKENLFNFLDLYYPERCSFEIDTLSQDKLVSIIVPTYNSGGRIINTLDTIKQQTYKNFECLIINDGSTDNTVNIVEAYCKDDPRFKCITKKNGGVSSARNLGIEEAKGDYICFSDDDDINLPNRLEVCVNYLNKYKENFVYCLLEKRRLQRKPINGYQKFGYYSISKDNFDMFSRLSNVNSLIGTSQFIKNNKFVNAHLSEDVLYNIELLITNGHIVVLNYLGYIYVERKNSAIYCAKKLKQIPNGKQNQTLNAFEEIVNKYKKSQLIIRQLLKVCLKKHYVGLGNVFTDTIKFNQVLKKISDLDAKTVVVTSQPRTVQNKSDKTMLKIIRWM